jgi:type I restriction enzyme S subunit
MGRKEVSMDALLAIKPEFAQKILAGDKEYEFRRTAFDDPSAVDHIYLYASAPEQRIVGVVTTTRVIEARPEELWELFGDSAGIDRVRFFDYFDGCETGYAIHIDSVHEFENGVDPFERLDDFSAPMSFCYLSSGESERLRSFLPARMRESRSAKLVYFLEQ